MFNTNLPPGNWIGYSTTNSLTEAYNKIYGITAPVYSNGAMVYRYNPVTDTTTVVMDISKYDIGTVYGSLTQGNDSMLYGMSVNGGYLSWNTGGIIFKIDPVNKTYNKVFEFQEDSTGNAPHGSLLKGSDGLFYGMTKNLSETSSVVGVIFSFDPQSNNYTKLYEFTDSVNGKFPLGSLIEGTDGNLYGMTPHGGIFGYGVIFRFNPSTLEFTKLFDFDGGLVGGYPQGDLLQASNGKLYGMTLTGGLNTKGVIFAFDPVLQLYEVIENFTVNDKGALPFGSLTEVHAPASLIYQTPDIVACLGSEFEIQAIATGGYLYHTWYHDGVVVGGNSKSIVLSSTAYADSGKYWCNIYNDLGSVVSDTIYLKVIPAPVVSLSFSGPNPICMNDAPVELSGTPSGGVYSGNGIFGNYFLPSYSAAGLNEIVYTYSYGCTLSDTLEIETLALPPASIDNPGDTTICLNGPVLTLTGSPAGGAFSGDGTSGNVFDPAIAGPGAHIIYYTYTDVCSGTDSILITVDICTEVETIPSMEFTVQPNPFTDILTIYLPQSLLSEAAQFKLIDQLGHIVRIGTISSATFQIQRDQLAPGLYLLDIESSSIQMQKKVVIE